ncbi:hypothetical protein [Hymenobacter qilianensis]|uniref:Uncharacterized protein n=1 Tax=Hymenobacter qilianensis TaxID=1385715 RepID=A0A7H0GTG0_9BACT|nr:hypothetical protein [Hymenobacter qilianensis]QNP51576.1 hypothetical protein H9L05_16505 [Hymenobacter qilianensis]
MLPLTIYILFWLPLLFIPSCQEAEAKVTFYDTVKYELNVSPNVFVGPKRINSEKYQWYLLKGSSDTVFVTVDIHPHSLGLLNSLGLDTSKPDSGTTEWLRKHHPRINK